ncbi:hypothetical protein NDI76_19430 [Halogeometricum sp. S1BR25-6]|uniref:Piwi domain-containing protein n=1 Tax=Halogeometricum salsisoli TaxID=2950536 RepID=A0ABU2GLJ1_9EURY|nr:Piwi domain-containing protein [Halogeometricum sp. S1BR25-6]MDS0300923.1 hypothetical protein [Halogeometricum sp. S1BR25-6]
MTTQADIEDKKPIDIRVHIISELDCPSPQMAMRFRVQDTDENEFPFTVWKNNALSDYAWQEGQWYKLENARGNEFRGQLSLNGSSSLMATPIEEPTDVGDADSTPQLFDSLTEGYPYLTLFPLGRNLATLTVYEYQIEAIDTFDQSPMQETYRLAAYLRKNNAAAVTHARTMTVIATSPLNTDLPGPFSLTSEQKTELKATDESDRRKLERLLQQLLKDAVDQKQYRPDRINRIVAREPVIKGSNGLYEACRAYGLRLEILPTGNVFVGVEVRHHARSQVTLDEYIDRTGTAPADLAGTHVEHDPDHYDVPGSGTLEGFVETRFTDLLPDLGNQSLADWYEQKRRIPESTLDDLRAENPQLVEIKYNPTDDETRIHVPHLLRVAPRKEAVKAVAPVFHRQWDAAAKLLPDDRFSLSAEFIAHLDTLSEIDATIDPTPVGPSRSFFSATIDRSDNLLFGNGQTADVPSRGLGDYGIHERPESFHVHYLVPERFTPEFKSFRTQFENQLDRAKCTPDSVTYHEYQLGSALDYNEVTASLADASCDAVLAVVPAPDNEFICNGTIDDPYGEFKKAFGKQSTPTQMVTAENLDSQWVHRNTALGLIAGAGGIPWCVKDMPGDADCFIGLDATYDREKGQFLGASANVVLANGTVFVSKSQSLQSGETFDEDAIVDILKDIHREFVRRKGRSPAHIVIHRDGRLFEDAETILEPFDETDIEIDIVDVRKSGAPRAALRMNESFQIDEKGRLFIEQGGDYGFLTTTGRPEFDESAGLGTPRTLRVVRRAGDTDLQTLLEQIYWLSESHVGSAQRSTRLPISTYYADRCAEHARKGYLVNGELIHGLPYL